MRLWGKKTTNRRNKDPVAMWMTGSDTGDIVIPGYIPLTKNEEVKKCIHKIADLVSSMTIMLMENGETGDRRLKNELSRKIDVYPNSMMTRKNFIYKIVADMLASGNSVVYPKVSNGLIDDLILWDRHSVTFSGDNEGYAIRYKGKVFNPDEVLHFVLNPDEQEPFKGVGYVNALRDTIETLVQANTTKRAFLKSKWKPSLIIRVDADVQELQDEEYRNKILDSYVGNTEQGKPWLLPGSEIEVQQVKPLSLNDLAIQESITLDKKAVASAFGVPPFMLGVEKFNRDEYNNFIASVVMPIAKNIEQEKSKKLVYKPTWYFKFNAKTLMQYNLAEKTAHVKEMVAGGMLNRNEGRNEFDYSPVEGLDEYIVLENYVPVSKVGDQKKLIQGTEPEGSETIDNDLGDEEQDGT